MTAAKTLRSRSACASKVCPCRAVSAAARAGPSRAGSCSTTTATLHLLGGVGDGARRESLAGLYGDLAVLLTTAEEAAEQVRTQLAEPRGGVVATCNGVDVPSRPQGPAGHAVPRVGVHARLTRQKGLDVLIAAVPEVLAAGVPMEVCIGGAGREEAALRSAAVGLPVRFTGFVPQPREFLRDLDVFCHPSRSDALPLSLLEAMAEGLPWVTSDVGDVRRRVGDATLVVPPEDPDAVAAALVRLLRDPTLRASLGAAARACAERHLDADDMVATTYALLRQAAREVRPLAS